jgi:hypothetical protein
MICFVLRGVNKNGNFQMSSISIWFILSKSKAEMHISYTRLYILHCFLSKEVLLFYFKTFSILHLFSYNEEKTSFSKFQKSSHFHSDITSIWSMYFINKQPKFWKKINSLSYLIWNSISEGSWLFHDSKGLTHTFCMWYSRTGMCMYSVVYFNRYTTYILDSV